MKVTPGMLQKGECSFTDDRRGRVLVDSCCNKAFCPSGRHVSICANVRVLFFVCWHF